MFKFSLILAGLMAAVVVGSTGTEARAEHGASNFGFGGSCGPTQSYSTRSSYSYGSNSSSHRDYGYGGSWSAPRQSSSHGRGHSDYRPTSISIHRGHIDVNAGHYDRHRSSHSRW